MRWSPRERDRELGHGQGGTIGSAGDCGIRPDLAGTRMAHEASINIFKGISFDENVFASTTFLSRRPQESNTARYAACLEGRYNTEKTSEGRSGDQIVSAGVSDPRKRIVLCIESDNSAATSILSGERCLDSVCVRSDLEAERLQKGNQVVVSVEFLEA